jgi:hypothetical protein
MINLDELDYCPLKPCVKFELKPSLGSAFLPLQQPARVMMDEAVGVIDRELSPTAVAVDTPTSNIQQPPPPPPLVPQLQGTGIDISATHTPAPCSSEHSNDHAGI